MAFTTRKAKRLPLILLPLVSLAQVPQVQALSFDVGEIEGNFDSTLSVGASWAMRDPDRDFVGVGNGGTASTLSSDDGRLNFKKRDLISNTFKGVHDLELKYGDSGVFLRGKYWYDFELKDGHQRLFDIDDSGRARSAKASGAEILDAFVYTGYEINELAGTARLGKQVVSWGENLFIRGVNQINPIDVAAFRRPGAEIKEGLIPVNMFYLGQDLAANLSMEAFYQLEWDKTVVDNCGTFFSGTDVVADGCNDRNLIFGSDYNPNNAGNLFVPRLKDRDARDGGQYGVALRWFVPQLNDTEIGLYAMNLHSRMPVYSVTSSSVLDATDPGFDPNLIGNSPKAGYLVEYPEDMRLYGLSFQTTLGSTSISGEFSYRPNMPLQLNSTDLTFAALGLDSVTGLPPAWGGVGQPISPSVINDGPLRPGAYVAGYKRMPVSQVQLAAIHFIDQVAGAERMSLLGEVAYNRINGLKSGPGELRFGRDSIYGYGEVGVPGLCEGLLNTDNPDNCNGHGFYTSGSWGYRLATSLEYSNVIAGINLTPEIAWSHDVDGYGPNFNEGAKSVYLALNASYLNRYSATISYTDFFGGEFNPTTDRDYVAASVSVSF
ncbi:MULTISPECIES: DUF1302 domain-containing protein [Pseudomonadaceae]|uniref:DUF1302 domain-containing protein n=1 Tax=Pseudomonadaceae TaxID=135621 RepID=UPI000FC40864|nr:MULTISPECIES: DUF1302 domain-containing protein [Pseudomonadaceae]MBD9514325.1 DUF1302 domain-containing protein [Pseudomonas sp. PDM22]MDH0059466.1 DUF1302 domain-containing protein [Stutzerimonas stutzeri]RUD27025.1 DUF1302 domain-containing protein [Pseudomonas aeruginosa]